MISLKQIFAYFERTKRPTQSQFADTFASFWHKSERLPIQQVFGLNDSLDAKADKANTATKQEVDEIKTIANNAQAGIIPMGSAENIADLNTKPKVANHSYFVKSEKDAYGNPYIFRYDVDLADWVNTKKVEYINPSITEGAVTSNQKVSVSADFYITIPSGMDIYDNKGTHIRLNKSYTFKAHEGSGRIQYDAADDEFSSTHVAGLKKSAILIGGYAGQEVQLINSIGTITQLDADGNVKDVLYRAIYEKNLLQNISVGLSSRANITVEDKTITISKGQIYIQFGDGTSETITLTEEYKYTFLFSAVQAYNRGDKQIHIRDNQFGSTDKPRYNDIPLFIFDANAGICGGLLYQYWINLQAKKNDTNSVWHRAFISGLPNFNVDLATRKVTLINTSLDVYFGKNNFIRFSYADFEATIDAAGTSRLWFNSKYNAENGDKSVFKSGAFVDGYFLLGTVVAGKIYPEGSNYTIYYSDGTIQKGACTNTFIREVIQEYGWNAAPPFVMDEAKKTWLRLNNWAGDDLIVVFAIITDIHSGNRDTYKHVGYLAKTNELFGYDFISNNGDIGLNVASTNATVELANEMLDKFAIEHGKCNCPVLFVKGNHDMDAGAGVYLSEARLSNYLQKPSQRRYPQIKTFTNKAYGFMDIEAKKTRVIFLDSNDNNGVAGGYSYHATQLEWLINLLTDTPNDYTVVCLSHRFPDQKGDWLSNGQVVDHANRVKNEMSLKAILSGFINKTSGVSYPDDNINLVFDFTGASGKMAGVLCGDSHFDVETKVDGINIVCSQGYGGISALDKPEHGITTAFDFNNQMLIDVVAIKPEKREMKYFRMGAGGEDRDREFTF